ncbi:MAG TPA: hypothetical protein VFU88_06305 [Ktedonobacterales bacterium]|nr:hypothetical protein [Ktedonobacterales bacterium]
MRSILRVGGMAGGAGGLAALVVAQHAALMAVLVVVAAGVAAGLGASKWLEHAWYGRQMYAGLRAGVIGAGIAGAGALAGLLLFASHDAAVLARESAIGGLSLAPEVAALASAGWLVADLLGVVVAAVVGSLLAAVLAQLTGREKGVRFVRAVARAREASRPLREEGLAAGALARRTPMPLAGSVTAMRLEAAGASAAPGLRAGQAPALASPAPASGGMGASGVRRATGAPRAGGYPEPAAPAARGRRVADLPDQRIPAPAPAGRTVAQVATAEAQPPQPAPAATPAAKPARKRRSSAKPTAGRLTPEMIEALAAWARETDEDGETDENGGASENDDGDGDPAAGTRAPADSTYLNSGAPAKPRKRKKNATRDWIC